MARWRGGVKRDKYDTVFSDLVRERANFTCEYCRINYRHIPGYLHCSHVFGRRNQSVRLHPDNAFAHCLKCHEYLEENPVEFAEWAKDQLGRQQYDRLRLLSNKPTKFKPWEKELIHQHYLKERRRLRTLRKDGVITRIEFTLPEAA